MLQQVSQAALAQMLRREYPHWHVDYVVHAATEYMDTLHPQLDAPLASYIATGEQPDIAAEGMTLHTILALYPGMKYFDAMLLMDTFLKDPQLGKARILRRRTR